MPLIVECVFTDKFGEETSRYQIDWNNPTSRSAFARQADNALKTGGGVFTRAVGEFEPEV